MQCAIDPNTSDCNLGANAVQQMDSVFQSAPAAVQANFQSAHDSILTDFHNNYSWYDSYIPFNPVCTTVCSIGTQAEQLMQSIQRAMGQAPTPQSMPGGLDVMTLLLLLGGGYLALVYLAGRH